MPVNQISHDYLWRSTPNNKSFVFTHHFQTFNLNQPIDDVPDSLNNNTDSTNQQQQMQLEVLFEKPLTPSDVGKLNRLVIPKQHAERHFPLNTLNGADSGGMLLSFEDEDGKFWRFRYSYWNSSQSYVLTKGWSRYVKDKRLDAGDVVVFQRHRTDSDRLFITWRRRHDPSQMDASAVVAACDGTSVATLNPAHRHQQPGPDPEASAAAAGVVNEGRTVSFNGSTSSRTLRLFGVNMEYQFESDQSEPVTPDWSSSTSSSNAQQLQQQGAFRHYSHFNPQPS